LPNENNTSKESSQEERSKRQERAERILNAAGELIQRWGYGKTTMDDIARQAGVAKGTLYLHWKTKEDLFRSLYYHEEAKLMQDVQQRIANDPESLSMSSLMKHSVLATLKNPLMKAILLRDTDIVGEFARREYSDKMNQGRIEGFKALFEVLRGEGLLRQDISFQQLLFMWDAISWGFLVIGPLLPDEFQLPDEEMADLLADVIQRVSDLPRPGTAARQKESEVLQQYMQSFAEIFREQDERGEQS
jgi:AcrR family transcriptional regulator